MTMAENASDQTPAVTPPVDYRPQPRYGELAPEGWTWTPPQDEPVPAASAAASTTVTPARATRGSAERPASAAPGSVPGTAPAWDRPLTISLLVFGLLGAYFTISILGSLPQALAMLYSQAELGEYTVTDSVTAIITGGSIGQAVVWVAAAVSSILLLLRGRRAFYVPIIGGVVAFVLLVAAVAVVLAGDPALLEYLSQP
ncbi:MULTISPECIES: DUF6264 family protein [unclassified Cryobacterium]|uniref:DUF6264 family protein n=1 Tax=unclassified Cryobacterium TaxID=2649013 RepID=UPI000EF569D5|nr:MULTISPECIES: DUF6264 family protein [unclassified Cryobacterium]TFC51001.1 hypothetical protein E3O68_15875 [Cryobacterium sp. TMB3-1-2]TFC57589.1 hypothetical protein E3O60_16160 [Cryobacterium sp. TMB1-7]TFC74347.1 hypothetical protein E3T21_02165 [Cryobacterium sp. TMB3-15]TFC79860.1 hypothetical protein E3T22_00440 [Cryobacterium sp. TMB3-10]TFC85836.1 hypothetical protein E3T19_15780 [Cryobacterium sp. TMT4-31]